ncbi:glycosyltransferase [Marinobacterium lacunae]|uniref:glycosyltransferase n=1 Tax=Marinobacterium lacunae TaxID=1232683 RepID=UPI0005665B37|nr:glycosyltransferase [Marinobacterium lacunae]
MKFSIVTVCFNNLDEVIKTYASLVTQDLLDYEWIVVDGSACSEIKVWFECDNKIENKKLISEKDLGIYDGMNKGLIASRGDYVIFMNSGDIFYSDSILSKVACLSDSGRYDFIYGDALEKYGDREKLKKAYSHRLVSYGMFTHHQAMYYRRSILIDCNLQYDLRYSLASDYDFTVRFLKNVRVVYKVSSILCVFDCGGSSTMRSEESFRQQIQIKKENFGYFNTAISSFIKSFITTLKVKAPFLYEMIRYGK